MVVFGLGEVMRVSSLGDFGAFSPPIVSCGFVWLGRGVLLVGN